MKTPRLFGPLAAAAVLAASLASTARADVELLSNGGFELGLSGWTRVDQVGSEGTFALQTGTTSPVNGFTVPAPPEGTRAAMTDAFGPGSHVMYQDFVVPNLVQGIALRFQVYIGNQAGAFFVPADGNLDFSTPALNQQARVDIITTGANVFSVNASDIVVNAFRTNVGNSFPNGYFSVDVNVTGALAARAGQTLRLRFAEVDNVNAFTFGVDGVSVLSVPEPSSLMLGAVGGVVMLSTSWLRRRIARR